MTVPAKELSIPERTLRTLSFCEPTPRHLVEWLEHLPMVNLGEASRQLYHAVIELNQLIIEPEIRLKLLELIRPPVQHVCNALNKFYLNQPVLLPEKARKVSRLAMALDNHLAVGYKIIVHDNAQADYSLLSRKSRKSSTLAIHRAVSLLGRTIVRAYELYLPPPEKAWQELHKLYLIAESNKIQDTVVEDRENKFLTKSTIADAYKRIVMVGCCKPNQIRQQDIINIYEATEMWTKKVDVAPVRDNSSFVVNLGHDGPPVYRDLARKKLTLLYRTIDFAALLKLLQEYLAQPEGEHDAFVKGISVPKTVPGELLGYLVRVWTSLTERSFSRSPSDKPIKLCIGFTAAHYFVSGGVDFEEQLQKSATGNLENSGGFVGKDVKSISDYTDNWAGGFDVAKRDIQSAQRSLEAVDYERVKTVTIDTASAAETKGFNPLNIPPQYEAQLIDTSPNGYRIRWPQIVPKEIKTGEIVAVNEGISHAWSVGVIRWINNQQQPFEVQMGIEIIATGAIPCGAKVVTQTKRRSDYMRALLLPSMKTGEQNPTLFTPNLPFKSGVKIIVNQYGEVSHGNLGKRIFSTGSFSQFIYHPDTSTDLRDESDDNIEDLWPDI